MKDLGAKIDALTEEEQMVRDSAATFFAGDDQFERVRRQRGQLPGYSIEVWKQMADMGWRGLAVPENLGGSSGTFSQILRLLEQKGRSLSPEPLIASGLMPAAAIRDGDNEVLKQKYLPQLASGELTLTLAWQGHSKLQKPTHADIKAETKHGSIVLNGSAQYVPAATVSDAVIIAAKTNGLIALYLVNTDAKGLSFSPRARVDGSFWSELKLKDVLVDQSSEVASAQVGRVVLGRVLDEVRLAISAELLGIMAQALEVSVAYMQVRKQFGRPIGSFQALQHRAVDALIQTEVSRSVVFGGALVFDSPSDLANRAVTASRVKARVARAALDVTKACVQIHGGIGFTDECSIGLFLKRAMVLSSWLGGAACERHRYARLVGDMGEIPHADEPQSNTLSEMQKWIGENFPQSLRFSMPRKSVGETRRWHKSMFRKGWAAPGWPREYGGLGMTAYEQLALQAELDRVGVNIAPNIGVMMLGPLLIRYGTEEQRAMHLPKILSCETLWCQGYSEPGAGSDLASLRTSATLVGSEFVVNGQKTWTSYADEADMMFVLVRTDPAAKRQRGISFLLVDMRSPGITVRPILNLAGGAEFCDVFFDDVRVPVKNLVGRLNDGWSMAKNLLTFERIGVGRPHVAKYSLRLLQSYAQEHSLLDDAVFSDKFYQLWLDVEDLGVTFSRYADVLRRGGALGPEVSILKVWITEVFQRVTDLLAEACSEGAVEDEPVVVEGHRLLHAARLYLMSRSATIYAGSNEIQRNILAREVLELPG